MESGGSSNLFREQAGRAAGLLKALSNENRLLVMCYLAEAGEMSVGGLADKLGLSQSALSQHLGKLRDEGLVETRRQSQTIHYRVSDPKAEQLLTLLHDLFCPDLGREGHGGDGRATSDLSEAARAATYGAIETLLVDIDAVVPGTLDDQSGAISFADTADANNYGVVDEIASRALTSGARILGVRKADLPGSGNLAAILRYGV